MYHSYFGFAESPFTITPDAKFLYLSPRHRDALAHLKYGLFESNGFVLLTGEVGTGKTVLCRSVLEQLPEGIDAALILNPRQTALELVANICDELRIRYPQGVSSIKLLIDLLNAHLLENYARGRRTVLIIDEAQNLSEDVLEQVRLLTNLETSKHKLLQILLVGQPELNELLARPQLRQLDQRITARYHIPPLGQAETVAYIQHRLAVAGVQRPLFTPEAAKKIHVLSKGIPRLINVICDRALLGAYAENTALVGPRIVARAAHEVLAVERRDRLASLVGALVVVLLSIALGISVYTFQPRHKAPADDEPPVEVVASGAAPEAPPPAPAVPTAAEEMTATPAGDTESAPVSPAPVASGAGPAAAAAAEATGVDLHALMKDPQCASTTDHGIATLFELWGQRYVAQPGLGACELAAQAGLQCLQGNGGWDDLRAYNRPAIIEVRGAQGGWQHLVVTAIADGRAVVRCVAHSVTVDLATLRERWAGEYLLLWQPPGQRKRLELGDRGPDVLLLREQLEQALDIAADPAADAQRRALYDDGLRALVMQFQRRHALRADGIAGKATLMLLQTLTGDDSSPRLDRPAY